MAASVGGLLRGPPPPPPPTRGPRPPTAQAVGQIPGPPPRQIPGPPPRQHQASGDGDSAPSRGLQKATTNLPAQYKPPPFGMDEDRRRDLLSFSRTSSPPRVVSQPAGRAVVPAGERPVRPAAPPKPGQPMPAGCGLDVEMVRNSQDLPSMAWVPLDSGRLHLCLRTADEILLQNASNLVLSVLRCDHPTAVDCADFDDPNFDQFLIRYHGWLDSFPQRASAASGIYAGVHAIGCGSNKTVRTRTSKLSLSIAILADCNPPHAEDIYAQYSVVADALRALVTEAMQRKVESIAASNLHSPSAQSTGPTPPPPPRAKPPPADQSSRPPPPPPPKAQPSPLPPPQQIRPRPPASPTMNNDIMIQGHRLQTLLNMGIPRECLEDPYVELRPWNGGMNTVWPYCTICSSWSDSSHLAGQKHRRRLANYGPAGPQVGTFQQPPPQPFTQSAVLPALGDTPAPAAKLAPYPAPPPSACPGMPKSPAPAGVRPPYAPAQVPAAPAPAAYPAAAQSPIAPSMRKRTAPPPPTNEEFLLWQLPRANVDWSSVSGPMAHLFKPAELHEETLYAEEDIIV